MSDKKDWKLFLRLYTFIAKYNRLLFVGFLLLLVSSATFVTKPYLIRETIDNHILNGDMSGFRNMVIIIAVVMTVSFLTSFLFDYLMEYMGLKIMYDIRTTMYQKLFRLNRYYFDNHSVGKTLTYISNDVESLREFLSTGIVEVISDGLKIVVIVGVMIALNPLLGLISASSIPLFLLITLLFRKPLENGYKGVRGANGEINRSLDEGINGIREIKMYNVHKHVVDEMEKANGGYLRSFLKIVYTYSFYFPLVELLSNVVLAGIFLYMHYYMGVTVTVGNVFAYFLYANMIFAPLRNIIEKLNVFQSTLVATDRIFTFLDNGEEERTGGRDTSRGLRGDIVFNGVNFAYGNGNPVLKNINLTIKEGERVAFVGRTGSGKSTLIKLLTGMYELKEGDITVGGQSIKEASLESIRSSMTNISQKTFFISQSIKDNIKLLREDLSDERVYEVCKELEIHDVILAMEGGYDREVGEDGKKLSLGQKQLLVFARAMMEEKSIVILDEATASIDSHSEKLVEKAMNELLENKTAIIIAHRLSTIQSVDKIVVLHGGEIVEMGSHDELMKKSGGYYRRIYEIQSIAQS